MIIIGFKIIIGVKGKNLLFIFNVNLKATVINYFRTYN